MNFSNNLLIKVIRVILLYKKVNLKTKRTLDTQGFHTTSYRDDVQRYE
ncbi:hypothetical protein JOD26_001605 [Limosilactobacillus caviae]